MRRAGGDADDEYRPRIAQGWSSVMACPNCASTDLVKIELSPGGRPMRFSTCRACEHRWWTEQAAADVVSLERVLAYVAAA